MVRAMRGVEDFMPQVVAFSVDFYSTLFTSVCISTSGSWHLSALFIATDVAQSILEFREVRENATTLLQLFQDRQASQIYLSYDNYPGSHIPSSWSFYRQWSMILATFTHHRLKVSDYGHVYLIFSRKHKLSSSMYSKHSVCTGVTRCLKDGRNARSNQNFAVEQLPSLPSTQPTTQKKLHFPQPEGPNINPGHAEHSKKLVQQGLQLLFHCEYLVLVEFTECIVPLVFVIFKSIVAQLPNIVYYPGGAGSWTASTVSNVLVFASLEIGSLLLLNIFLRRKFGFSPLYQLAFVLETQIYQIQSSLVIEIIILLQYELLHLGADFTLQLEWLERKG